MNARDPSGDPRYFIVGRIRRPHGMRGEVVVDPLTDSPDVVLAPGRRLLAGNRQGDLGPNPNELRVATASAFKQAYLVRFEGIDDLETAERWRDRYLLVERDALPSRNSDEVYLHQLVGLSVQDPSGRALGVVQSYYDLPHGVMLEVTRGASEEKGARGTYLLPYRDEFVRSVEIETGRLVVSVPEGFFE